MHIDRTGYSSIDVGWQQWWHDGQGADGYVVYRSTSSDNGFTRVGVSSEPNYHDTGLDLDTAYYYRVYAYNDVAGLGRSYSSVSATTNASQPVADINGDGDVDCDDVNLLSMEIATGGVNLGVYDFNDDGQIELADLHEWLALAGEINLGPGFAYLPGDANLSGGVDGSDFNIWNSYKFTGMGSGGGGGFWCLGDLNADGGVDGSDFNIWNSNKFQSYALPVSTLRGPRDLVSIVSRDADASVVWSTDQAVMHESRHVEAIDGAWQSYRRDAFKLRYCQEGIGHDEGDDDPQEATFDMIFANV